MILRLLNGLDRLIFGDDAAGLIRRKELVQMQSNEDPDKYRRIVGEVADVLRKRGGWEGSEEELPQAVLSLFTDTERLIDEFVVAAPTVSISGPVYANEAELAARRAAGVRLSDGNPHGASNEISAERIETAINDFYSWPGCECSECNYGGSHGIDLREAAKRLGKHLSEVLRGDG